MHPAVEMTADRNGNCFWNIKEIIMNYFYLRKNLCDSDYFFRGKEDCYRIAGVYKNRLDTFLCISNGNHYISITPNFFLIF